MIPDPTEFWWSWSHNLWWLQFQILGLWSMISFHIPHYNPVKYSQKGSEPIFLASVQLLTSGNARITPPTSFEMISPTSYGWNSSFSRELLEDMWILANRSSAVLFYLVMLKVLVRSHLICVRFSPDCWRASPKVWKREATNTLHRIIYSLRSKEREAIQDSLTVAIWDCGSTS